MLPSPTPPAPRNTLPRLAAGAAGLLLARARFVLLGGLFLGVVAGWPFLSNAWDKFMRPVPAGAAVSSNTEYWCPMCPGVVSDWPTKCPVCSMTLVRRQKGEMTPLPDGVLARVQLSPYRVQLAGLRTVPVEYRRLEYEVTVAGRLAAQGAGSPLVLTGQVFERDGAALRAGQEGTVACKTALGTTAPGRVVGVTPASEPAGGYRVRVAADDPHGELRPGLYAAATFRVPVSQAGSSRRLAREQSQERVALGLLGGPDAACAAVLDAGVREVLTGAGLTLAVPEGAVIDTGTRMVVYVETMAGMFDAVEVYLGRRCGDDYPVRAGLKPGQRVVAVGAVLLDAETRLNPGVAASYFGAGSRGVAPPPEPPALPPPSSPGSDDRELATRQKTCPVTGEDLDAMGGPVRVSVNGRTVFVCCKACVKPLRQKPEQYLKKLPK